MLGTVEQRVAMASLFEDDDCIDAAALAGELVGAIGQRREGLGDDHNKAGKCAHGHRRDLEGAEAALGLGRHGCTGPLSQQQEGC